MTCRLCELAEGNFKTRCYYEDRTVVVVDCITCGIPIVVLKKHSLGSMQEIAYMHGIAEKLFTGVGIRLKMRSIPDHKHFHVMVNGHEEAKT